MDELRVNVDDVHVTTARYQVSAEGLASDVPAGAERSFQPTATAVRAVHAGAETARAVLSARTATTADKIAAADAHYFENEAESAAKLRAVDPQVR